MREAIIGTLRNEWDWNTVITRLGVAIEGDAESEVAELRRDLAETIEARDEARRGQAEAFEEMTKARRQRETSSAASTI